MEYIATDPTRTTIPWVQRENADGSETVFTSSALNGAVPQGERRTMDCIDCHNRASHTFVTRKKQSTEPWPMAPSVRNFPGPQGGPATAERDLRQPEEARATIPAQLEAFYRTSIPRCCPQRPRWLSPRAKG